MTRLQLDAISKIQEIIALAKAGKKSTGRTLSHKEFLNRMKCKLPKNFKYDVCSEDAKKRWLAIVEKNKTKN